ncbi:hypothetical protein [Jiella mangrovi]|uniref:DNA topoisomerase IV subunit B n=1 Tax=Jiella mangrovi TaxID=2821407 RepID=A0ABS4BG87_9HYPH|nr:hypothetical protein [Jiella mangrovi]MBP0615201.1 hypothetical protein [Jiella mangrovi]
MSSPSRSQIAGILAASLLFAAPASAQDGAEPPAAQPAAPQQAPAAAGTDAAAPSSSEFASAIESLSPMVQDVQVVGPWSDGDAQGVWRTVMVQPAGNDAQTYFFIQQLEASGEGALAVRSSAEIPEIGKMDGQVVGYRADDPSDTEPNSLTLFFEVVPSDGEISETYELHYVPGQPYVFGPASN